MLKFIIFIVVMSVIAPELTSMGRPYCGPETFVPLRCGSFYWFSMLILVPLAMAAISIYRIRERGKDAE